MADRYADVEFEGDARPWRISVGDGDTDESVRRHCAGVWPAQRVARVTFGTDAGVPEVDRLRAELAAVTAERERLMSRWPNCGPDDGPGWVWLNDLGVWHADGPDGELLGPFATKRAAVRAAAGLAAETGGEG